MNNSFDVRDISVENSNKPNNIFGLLIIILFGLISIFSVVAITMYSINTKTEYKVDNSYYSDIQGSFIDTTGNNLFVFKNGSYEWYKNYSSDKKQYIEGSMKVVRGLKALETLNLSENKINKLLDIYSSYSTKDVYYLRLFTSEEDVKYSYYKILLVNTDKELALYNYNSKEELYFTKSN